MDRGKFQEEAAKLTEVQDEVALRAYWQRRAERAEKRLKTARAWIHTMKGQYWTELLKLLGGRP